MLESPFAFYRGAALVMASDLATTSNAGLQVQCCGDAHLANFGGFASPDRVLVFDINDFDETNPGPFEWDVKRLAASFEIAARSRGFPTKTARQLSLHADTLVPEGNGTSLRGDDESRHLVRTPRRRLDTRTLSETS